MRATAIATALVGLLLLIAPVAAADTYDVTRRNDPAPGQCKPNSCSLREAIRAANAHAGSDVVVLRGTKPYKLSRSNPVGTVEDAALRGDLDVTDPLKLTHPGRGLATIDANGIDRALQVHPGARTRLARIRVTGGDHQETAAPPPPRTAALRCACGAPSGGGILAESRLTLVRSAVTGNRGAYRGGGIEASDGLTAIRSRISGNVADSWFVPGAGASGGIDGRGTVRLVRTRVSGNSAAGDHGGLAVSPGKLVLVRSRVTGNRAPYTGGITLYEADGVMKRSTVADNIAFEGRAGGIGITLGDLRIVGSTISGNRALGDGGGVSIGSGGAATVRNSTVAGNRAGENGGGFTVEFSSSSLTLESATVARNTAGGAGSGGGIWGDPGASVLTLNSIIALNRAGSSPDDCDANFSGASTHNLLRDPDGCTGLGIGSGDFVTTTPKLGPLRNNGGRTKTIGLRRGSPAIGKAQKSSSPKRDQRGRKRDNQPDIGAFER
jgi:CSLREA domain-containing protein